MNWNMDVKDLTGQQIAGVVIGILVFASALCYLAAYRYGVILGILAFAAIIYAKWYLSNREHDKHEQSTSEARRPRSRK